MEALTRGAQSRIKNAGVVQGCCDGQQDGRGVRYFDASRLPLR